MTLISRSPEWRALEAHRDALAGTTLRDLFAADPTRGQAMTVEAEGIYFDYSKQRVT